MKNSQRSVLLKFAILLAGAMPLATQASAQRVVPVIGVGGGGYWSQSATAFGDYMRWLGQLRLDTARAAHEEALAAQDWVRARAMARSVALLEHDARNVEMQINKMRRTATNIENRVRALNGMLQGVASSHVTGAANSLLVLLPPEAMSNAEGGGLLGEAPEFSESDFIVANPRVKKFNQETKTFEWVDNELKAFAGGNYLQFLGWLRKTPVRAKLGSPGHVAMLKLREALLNGSQAWLEQINQMRQAAEDRRNSIWGPVYAGEFGLPAREPIAAPKADSGASNDELPGT